MEEPNKIAILEQRLREANDALYNAARAASAAHDPALITLRRMCREIDALIDNRPSPPPERAA